MLSGARHIKARICLRIYQFSHATMRAVYADVKGSRLQSFRHRRRRSQQKLELRAASQLPRQRHAAAADVDALQQRHPRSTAQAPGCLVFRRMISAGSSVKQDPSSAVSQEVNEAGIMDAV